VPTTAHSRSRAEFVPDHDATAVAKWREAGSVLLGKLNTFEFAVGGMEAWGPAKNPWNPAHVTGGSSTGSGAGLAAGMVYGATGSDTGGSIRGPANLCGIVGLKPTYGRVSRYGVFPLSWSLDHCGPMARTVADCAVLLQAMAGHDPHDPTSAQVPVPDYSAALKGDLKGVRIGVPRGWFFQGLHPETAAAVEATLPVLRDLGAELVEVEIKYLDEAHAATMTICFAEGYSVHEQGLSRHGELYGPRFRQWVLEGGLTSAADYLRCLRVRELFVRHLREDVFSRVDALISPVSAAPAASIDDYGNRLISSPSQTRPGNLAGIPCMSVPCGFTANGLPIGLMVMGRWWEDGTVLSIGHAYEQATPWHLRRPALAL
jgi:aspartyl-tRNA(Asn)/glutamyl-tRNA(Gln) amidotransferase subunit A